MKKYYLSLILLIALILRLINLNQSLWLDEAAQALESARPLSQQLNIVADFHPPLYHIFLHFWMLGGKSEIWLRTPSVLFGIGAIFLLIKIGRLLGHEKASLLGGLFFAISPFAIWYSQEIRPYIFFTFFSLLSTYFLLKKNWSWYTATSVLTIYSNYFAPFLFLSQILYVLFFDKKNIKILLALLIIIGLAFLPWFPFFLDQLKVGTAGVFRGWSQIVSVEAIKVIPLTLAKFIFGRGTIDNQLLYALILSPILIIFLYSVIILGKEKSNWKLFFFFFIPLLSVTFITAIIPIAAPQRLLFISPYFLLIIAASIEKLPPKEKYFCILLVVAVSLAGLWQYYTDEKVQREKWREAVLYIEKSTPKDSVALFIFPTPFAPWQWYNRNIITGKGIAPAFIVRDEDLINLEKEIFDKKGIFLFQYLSGLTDPEGKTLAKLNDLGYKQSDIKNFAGVGFIYVLEKPL